MADGCTGFNDLKYSEGVKGVTALSTKRKGTQKANKKKMDWPLPVRTADL